MDPSFINLSTQFKLRLEQALEAPLGLCQDDGFIQISSPELAINILLYPHNKSVRSDTSDPCIHIDEDQLITKFDLIVRRIVSRTKNDKRIYARNTVVARIDKRTSLQFLVEHHLQAALPGKYRYGLYEQGELVAVAIFTGGRRMLDKDEDYRSFELIRFCNKTGINVIGGLSKLIKAFCSDFSPGDIMTFTDRDWSQHSSLEKIGFVAKEITAPISFWITGTKRYTYRNTDELKGLREQFPNGFPKENMGSIKMILYIK
ncbi:hypothetical protein [Sphingobacterium sp.]|uniref:hypothetical protein n=1 Tax=Sphingobacterium sp. TaxID=341027 RepID=UPI002584B72C|nr:hypothetical protein [Sphingobacterium sp.]WET71026.1 MAG: hypothetical protein P0Y57_08050 [Sphingobacterium sp.]